MPVVSLVVPCYNEEESLPLFMQECQGVMRSMRERHGLTFEFVFVDDGSKDGTLAFLKTLQPQPGLYAVAWASFSRNFGKEAALLAGLREATGELVAIMDADMQDPPSLLPEMYEKMQATGCDCVATARSTRTGEGRVRSALSNAFYHVVNPLTEVDFMPGERDYRLMKRPVVDAILSLTENNRFTKGIYGWVGFDTEWITYDNVERVAGETKWNLGSLMKYAMNGITAFSTAPLQVASAGSLLLFAILIVALIFVLVRALIFGDPVAGWASTICVILFVGSLQLFCLGVLGQYLAKTYLEVKERPLYIIKDEQRSE